MSEEITENHIPDAAAGGQAGLDEPSERTSEQHLKGISETHPALASEEIDLAHEDTSPGAEIHPPALPEIPSQPVDVEVNPVDERITDPAARAEMTPSLEPAQLESSLNPVEHVRQQALAIFDFTQPFHALGKNGRHILETAALLHDLSLPPTKKKPLRAMQEIIRSHSSVEFDREEGIVLATVLAYQRGLIRRKHFDSLDLSPVQQREVLTIAALLRIAIGLNASGTCTTTVTQVDLGRDEMWIVVEGPHSKIDSAASQQAASLWVKIGYPETKVMGAEEAAAIRIPFPEPSEKIGILPDDTLAEAGRKVMRFNFARMLSYEEGTRKGEDIEALHDMRVATRRMRASFEVFGEAFERRVLKNHLTGLRQTGRLLGAVRDLDVFMEKARHYEQALPEDQRNVLDFLLHSWQEQRQEAREKMIEYFNSPEYFTFKRDYNIFLNSPGAGSRSLTKDQPLPYRVREVAPVMIYSRLAAVRAYDPWLEDAPIERLHALRIEFKQLRYTVEFFREVLGPQAATVIEELKTIQDHLGDLNDAQVAIDILGKFIDQTEANQADLPIEQRVNLQPVVAYLAYRHEERYRLMQTFHAVWKHFQRKEFRKRMAQAVSIL